jgi:methane monooxygenase PmoA-like
MRRRVHCSANRLMIVCAFVVGGIGPVRAEVTAEKHTDKVTIKIDGQLFTEYLTDSNGKPILWPIIGPTGAAMTRSYPMKKVAGEATDHPHQRSFWFTHGDVNGVDFWSEGAKAGKQKHKEFVRVEGGKRATIVTRNDWLAPDGRKFLEDERQLTFFPAGDTRVIDFAITLAPADGAVTFGDTKEGSFGLRIAESMRAELKGDKGRGRILNSEGQIDDASTVKSPRTWGKSARWVDYSGPVTDERGTEEIAGITILNHPKSFRFPTHWHVRTYGLFAANPFGLHDFENKEKGAGSYTLQKGQTLSFEYRVIFHKGMWGKSNADQAFSDYESESRK